MSVGGDRRAILLLFFLTPFLFLLNSSTRPNKKINYGKSLNFYMFLLFSYFDFYLHLCFVLDGVVLLFVLVCQFFTIISLFF